MLKVSSLNYNADLCFKYFISHFLEVDTDWETLLGSILNIYMEKISMDKM